jgi:hypothetical protein
MFDTSGTSMREQATTHTGVPAGPRTRCDGRGVLATSGSGQGQRELIGLRRWSVCDHRSRPLLVPATCGPLADYAQVEFATSPGRLGQQQTHLGTWRSSWVHRPPADGSTPKPHRSTSALDPQF